MVLLDSAKGTKKLLRIVVAINIFWQLSAQSAQLFKVPADAFSSMEMDQIAKESKIDADLFTAKAVFAFHSTGNIRQQQAYLDTFIAQNRVRQQILGLRNNEYITVYTGSSLDYTNSPLYNDTNYLKNWFNSKNLRIMGGQVDDNHPDCVAVGSNSRFGGSGTLIASRLVVTAGHCFYYGYTNWVLVGADQNGPLKALYKVKQAITCPGYTFSNSSNDLCLLVLAEQVTNAAPRMIATKDMLALVSAGYIAGYGTTNNTGTLGFGLRRYAGPISFGNPAMSGAYSAFELVAGALDMNLDSIGMDTCEGDSGGPLYIVNANGDEYLMGVTSRGVPPKHTNDPTCGLGGIYVRLDVFLPWIRTIAQANGVNLQ